MAMKYLDLHEESVHGEPEDQPPPPLPRSILWKDRVAIALLVLLFGIVILAFGLGFWDELRIIGRLFK
jgi:hypothetical protein